MKARQLTTSDGNTTYIVIFCPGCERNHSIPIKSTDGHIWTFNDDFEKPTLSPSLNVFPDEPRHQCHSFVENGNIRFLNDCFHTLKNSTVPLPDIDEK